jgi:hypothetical protein
MLANYTGLLHRDLNLFTTPITREEHFDAYLKLFSNYILNLQFQIVPVNFYE